MKGVSETTELFDVLISHVTAGDFSRTPADLPSRWSLKWILLQLQWLLESW